MPTEKKIFLYEAVIAQLIAFMKNNQYQPGDKLPSERKLAASLAVSRTSIREALKTLQAKDIVSIRHGSGVYFNGPENFLLSETETFDKSQETFHLLKPLAQSRMMIESFCAVELASTLTSHQLKELYGVIQKEERIFEATQDHQDVFMSMELELLLSYYYGNPMIHEMHKKTCLQWQQCFLSLELTPYPLDLRHQDHLDIMKAIESGHSPSIEKAVKGHVQRTLSILNKLLKP
ncbi:DNA-binding transcriptional regulator, FadR family [Tindallia magadiensis]|uniref:DNA-binding transcriptional regulator, FadR family n=1 Tax=Tindallia magadiensis TaxID=69895 RepID=A0A1I3EWC6_9FIRM|nr:GntR family transcriptional regulator [Tindallia magadiensis]SFI03267.1 DNA-binding transcriptional regulator, FadR family [Tindallia magadiensis]